MGLFDAICEFVSDACSAVCDAFSSLGGSLGAVLSTAIRGLAVLFPPLSPIINTVANIFSGIANILGLVNNETADEIGMKADQGLKHGLTPEKFQSYKDYIEALRKEPLDHVKFNSLSPEERNAFQLSGTRILANGIEEACGIRIPNESVALFGMMGLDAQKTLNIIEAFKKNGSNTMQDLNDYMEEKLDASKVDATSQAIEDAIKTENPDATKKDLADQIKEWEENIKSSNL